MSLATIMVEPFRADHLAAIAAQADQAELAGDRRALGRALEEQGDCFTARSREDGRILFCGGAGRNHGEHATLWCAIAQDAGPFMTAITRRVLLFAARRPERRVDAVVRANHEAAHRWMAMLGFEQEALLRDYWADGADAMIYRLRRR